MKRLAVIPLTAALVIGAVGTVNAGPPRDSATGGGQSAVGTHIGISAHDGPKGASGHVVLKNMNDPTRGETQGHVTCIESVGNVATIVYQIDKADSEVGSVGQFRKLRLTDNGNPVKGQPVDRIQGSPATDAPQTCDEPLPQSGGELMHGNLRVVDGS
jgi:hypothetical protein